MGFLKRLYLLRSSRFNSCILHRRLSPSYSSSIMHWEVDNFTHSGGLLTRLLCNNADVSEVECDEIVDDGAAKKKHIALHTALTQLESHFEKESMLYLPKFFVPRCASVISTGSLKLDLALGIGGLPKGRIVEIYGKEASGKTTLALHMVKEAQKLGGYCAYLDAENAMDPTLAEAIGVDTKNLLISCPDSAENMLSIVDKLTQSGSLDVIVVDSVAALVPQCELDGDIGTSGNDALSKIMTKALRRIHYSLCGSKTLIIFVNQVRYSPRSNQSLGKRDEVTCGGNALGFYAAVRLRISRTGLLKKNDKVTGVEICVQVMKNKLATGMKSAETGINFGKGLRFEPEVLQLALEHGLILKEGNGYFIEGEVLNSEQAAERYLAENKEVLEKLLDNPVKCLVPGGNPTDVGIRSMVSYMLFVFLQQVLVGL